MTSWWCGAVLAALALTGCSSGGADAPAEPTPPDPVPSAYDVLAAELDSLAAIGETPYLRRNEDMPTTGSATFGGVMQLQVGTSLDEPDNLYALGDVSVDVDFGSNSLAGRADNFQTQDQGAVEGALAITNGVIDRNADFGYPNLSMDVEGSLQHGGHEYLLTGTGSGLLLNNFDYLSVRVGGSALIDGEVGVFGDGFAAVP